MNREEIEARAAERQRATVDALRQLRDNYIRGALEDAREEPWRDSRTLNPIAHFEALFIELVDRLLASPPVGLSPADWGRMLEDYRRSRQ